VRLAAAALAAALAGAAQAAPAEEWRFELTPYLFGASLTGTTGVGDVRAAVDMSFDDVLDNLDSGFMAMLEARKGKWGFGLDGVYFKLKDERTRSWQGPGGIGTATGTLEATMTQQVVQVFAAYRIAEGPSSVDVIGAARYTQLDSDLTLVTTTGGLLPGNTRSLSGGKEWWDGVIGVRATMPLAERWTLVSYADIGAGGSDIAYQGILGVNWQASKTFAVKGGYRYFYQDYEEGGFVWDMAAHGLYLGLGISF
jgi:opacity protein-like surface antigen